MNKKERLRYYLGDDLSNGNFDIETYLEQLKSHEEYDMKSVEKTDTRMWNIYYKPFLNILNKRENDSDKFLYKFCDVQQEVPILTFTKNRWNSKNGVILRSLEFGPHWSNVYVPQKDMDFEDKISKVVWRGSSTGQPSHPGNRFTLVEKWFDSSFTDVGFSKICQGKDDFSKFEKEKCTVEDMLNFKYILSVKGNDKDAGLNWKLNSNSLVMMPKPIVTSWLMETQLVPDYHYILLKDDFSDLEEKFNWCEENPQKCKDIVKNANKYMKQFSNKKQESELETELVNKYFDIINKKIKKLNKSSSTSEHTEHAKDTATDITTEHAKDTATDITTDTAKEVQTSEIEQHQQTKTENVHTETEDVHMHTLQTQTSDVLTEENSVQIDTTEQMHTETVTEEHSETVTEEHSETVTEEHSETVTEEHSETVAEDHSETVAEDHSETVAEEKSETVAEEKSETQSNHVEEVGM
jgi:hypothetical protein